MIERIILKIRRGESPFFRALRRVIGAIMRSRLPVPRPLTPLFRAAYNLHFTVLYIARLLLNYFYREPLFRARCERVGAHFHLWLMPEVRGPVRIYLGDHVNVFGFILIESSDFAVPQPQLIVHDRVDLGHNLVMTINRELVIEEDVRIASGVRFLDTDDYPSDPDARAANAPPVPEDAKPIRICRRAWIGQNSIISKGVTVGEGAIIGVNSVVMTDIPPYSVAMGNPARVVVKNLPRETAVPAGQS
jgi:acetyltransferase-like isoleucine patch superfamily enzyme